MKLLFILLINLLQSLIKANISDNTKLLINTPFCKIHNYGKLVNFKCINVDCFFIDPFNKTISHNFIFKQPNKCNKLKYPLSYVKSNKLYINPKLKNCCYQQIIRTSDEESR